MTPLERCLAVLKGEMPDRVPVVPQGFLFALETAGYTMAQANRDPEVMANAQVLCQEKFGYDGCVIDFDDASLAEACGATVIRREDEPSVVDESRPLLKDLRDVWDLKIPDPWDSPRLVHWLEATKALSREIGGQVFIMGRADQGPFSLACALRGMQQFMVDLATEEPEVIHPVIEYCREACLRFARAQQEAGAHATSIGDAPAGPNLISPKMYRTFAHRPERLLAEEIQSRGIPFSIHVCGDTRSIFPDLVKTKAQILELDSPVNMGDAQTICPQGTVLMGNINPSHPLVLGEPEDVRREAEAIIRGTKGRGLFLSSGCAMGRNTKPENVRAMVKAAEAYGTREHILEMNQSTTPI